MNVTSQKILTAGVFGGAFLAYEAYKRYFAFHIPDGKKAVIITGCDSGLGYSFSKFSLESGLVVFACVLNSDSGGAQDLASRNNCHTFMLDLKDENAIKNVAEQITHKIQENSYELIGLVNNAGIMILGELECVLISQIKDQIDVNFLGPIYLTKYLLPIIREHKARLIYITSHCAKVSLPSLSVYSATKTALDSFSQSLRIELERFGVKVITIIPGSFVFKSRIMSRQGELMSEMERRMSAEVKTAYSHFSILKSYLTSVAAPEQDTIGQIEDQQLFRIFRHALLAKFPRSDYKNEPFRYRIYHFLIRNSPTESLKGYFIKKFVAMPPYS